MKYERYHFVKQNEGYYTFYSEGPNGNIKKAVEFVKADDSGTKTFFLSFGDLYKGNKSIDDLSVSNNSDRVKILATVASAVVDFMENHPDAEILATGSTASRTRLYQMSIARVLDEINNEFEIFGLKNGTWKPFQRGINYRGFSLKNKQENINIKKINYGNYSKN